MHGKYTLRTNFMFNLIRYTMNIVQICMQIYGEIIKVIKLNYSLIIPVTVR